MELKEEKSFSAPGSRDFLFRLSKQSDLHNACEAIQEKKGSSCLWRPRRDFNFNSLPLKGHDIGKGLMAVWRLTNPGAGDFPTGLDSSFGISISGAEWSLPRIKKKRQQPLARKLRQREMQTRKEKPLVKRRKESAKQDKLVKQTLEKCGLAFGVTSLDNLERRAMLEDDEELELREVRARPNCLSSCDHCTSSIAAHSRSLCKGTKVWTSALWTKFCISST